MEEWLLQVLNICFCSISFIAIILIGIFIHKRFPDYLSNKTDRFIYGDAEPNGLFCISLIIAISILIISFINSAFISNIYS